MNAINNTKPITIGVPDNMNEQIAQQCFYIGLKNLIYINNGGALVSYLQDDKVKTTVLHGQASQILVKFLKAIQQTQQYKLDQKVKTGQTKKQFLQRNGSQLLDKMEQKK